MHMDVHSVELNEENKAYAKTEISRVSASLLAFNFLDLEFSKRIPEWSEAATTHGYKNRMLNPLRSIAKGDPLYTIFIDYFSDDVSGNRSKSWNKHWNTYMTNRSLPRHLLQNEFYVHFVSTSQHASIPEQFKEFQKLIKTSEVNPIRVPDPASSTGHSCYRLIVNADPRKYAAAWVRQQIFHAENAKRVVIKNIKLQTKGTMQCFRVESPVPRASFSKQSRGDEAELKKTYTASGIKNKYTEYWISDILAQFKKEVERGASKDTISVALKHPFLTTDGFDPPRDTPIELLHTILLGVLKYVWHSTHKSWTADQKKMFELRLQAADTSGLAVEGIRAAYIVQYANSLIGRQFKSLLQCAVFQLHDLVSENHFRAWKTVGELSALLWYPEIDDMESYCIFWISFAEIDPNKMITKVKTHLLTHAPSDVRLFGPLLGAITEAFESFNGVFRPCSILSNHRAPSRDIAVQLAAQESVKHRVAGGAWPLKGEGIVTVRPGGRTVPKTAVQWTVRRRYGSGGSRITFDGTGRWTGRPSDGGRKQLSEFDYCMCSKTPPKLVSDASATVGNMLDASRHSQYSERTNCWYSTERYINYGQNHPSHPSVFRLPVDGTAVLTAVRRRYGMLGRQELRDGTGRLSVRPSVQPSWMGPAERQLMQDQPFLQQLLGWKKAEIVPAGSLTLAPISVIKLVGLGIGRSQSVLHISAVPKT
ncbi:hypothetical protein DFH08DRAFT_814739 [Mycena albidolilacea]|uniref:Uncharacterized protein n=1 Tax=Mycena albidolilacea TaxID=1033008 RepID=A0AAD7EKC4_9AGAR|nr:hypothetical protein DFH08DRAFT_814739 [Mycena albidolilacea]